MEFLFRLKRFIGSGAKPKTIYIKIVYSYILPVIFKLRLKSFFGNYSRINVPKLNIDLNFYANLVLRNKIMIWGQEIDLTDNINWNKDYFSGYVWPHKYYKNIIKVPYNGADVKFPWELSRFHQSIWLANAYNNTKDCKYANKFIYLVNDWGAKNDYLKTVNWTCTMDISIRISNLIFAFFIFKQAGYNFEKDFESLFVDLCYKHGLYIRYNLEYSIVRGNHYTSDLVGLFLIGLLLRNKKWGKNWMYFSIIELEKEIKIQILNSGANFELSVPYHRLTTELFLYTYIFASLNNIRFSNNYLKLLKKQLDFTVNYTKPNNFSPLIGDNDSGHLFYFPCFDNRDHNFLVSLSKQYLNYTPKQNIEFTHYKDAGFLIYRTKKMFLFFKNSFLGLSGLGGHNHNDNLSFELNYNHRDIFVDPGTYVYTSNPEQRNNYRSIKNHNTIDIGIEPNNLNVNIFHLKSASNPTHINYSEKKKTIYSSIIYDCGVKHSRKIQFNNKFINILDSLSSKHKQIIKGYFNLVISPEMELEKDTSLKINEVNIRKGVIYYNCNLENCDVSLDYYSMTKTKKISIPFQNLHNFKIILGD